MSRPQRLNTFCHATASALCHELPVWVEVGRTTRPAPKMPAHSYCISLVMPLVGGSIAWADQEPQDRNEPRASSAEGFPLPCRCVWHRPWRRSCLLRHPSSLKKLPFASLRGSVWPRPLPRWLQRCEGRPRCRGRVLLAVGLRRFASIDGKLQFAQREIQLARQQSSADSFCFGKRPLWYLPVLPPLHRCTIIINSMLLALKLSFAPSRHVGIIRQSHQGSFKNRKPIRKIGCCVSRMVEQKH